MKAILEKDSNKTSAVIIDKSLNKLDNVVLFPEKVEKAKQTMQAIGLPEQRNSR